MKYEVVVLLVVVFLFSLVNATFLNFMALYGVEIGLTDAQVGILAFMPGIFSVLLPFSASKISNVKGRSALIRSSFVAYICGGMMLRFGSSVSSVFISQVIQGIGIAFFWPSVLAHFSEVRPTEGQGLVQAWNTGVQGIARLVGPAIGGLIIEAVGFRSLFGLCTLLAAIGYLASKFLHESNTRKESLTFRQVFIEAYQAGFRLLRRNRGIRYTGGTLFLGSLCWQAIGTTLYLIFLQRLGFSTGVIGMLVTLRFSVCTIGNFVSPLILRRLGLSKTFLLGNMLCIIALFSLSCFNSFPFIVLLAVIAGFGEGLILPSGNMMTAEHSTSDERSLAFSVQNVAMNLGRTAGALVFGQIATVIAIDNIFAIAGVVSLIGILGSYFKFKQVANARGADPMSSSQGTTKW